MTQHQSVETDTVRAAGSISLRIESWKKCPFRATGLANTLKPGSMVTKFYQSSLLLIDLTFGESDLRILISFLTFVFPLVW